MGIGDSTDATGLIPSEVDNKAAKENPLGVLRVSTTDPV